MIWADMATIVHLDFWADKQKFSTPDRILVRKSTCLCASDLGRASLRDSLVHTLITDYRRCFVLQAVIKCEGFEVDDSASVAVLKDRGTWNELAGLNMLLDWALRVTTSAGLMMYKMEQGCGCRSCTLLHTAFSVVMKPQQYRQDIVLRWVSLSLTSS